MTPQAALAHGSSPPLPLELQCGVNIHEMQPLTLSPFTLTSFQAFRFPSKVTQSFDHVFKVTLSTEEPRCLTHLRLRMRRAEQPLDFCSQSGDICSRETKGHKYPE